MLIHTSLFRGDTDCNFIQTVLTSLNDNSPLRLRWKDAPNEDSQSADIMNRFEQRGYKHHNTMQGLRQGCLSSVTTLNRNLISLPPTAKSRI